MNIVDSCGWLEYFADGKNAHIFAPIIENTTELLVPVISIYEVFKRVLQQRDESAALQTIASEVPDNADSEHKPYQLDRCHALASNSETVQRYYPRWYRNQSPG